MFISSLPAVRNGATLPARQPDESIAVSILVPTYNRCEFLASLLERLHGELRALPPGRVEVVVVDNASSDGTEAVGRKFERHDWFRYIRNAKNVGASKNLFVGLEFCRAAYIWWMGDDDYPETGVVGAVLDTLDWNAGVGIVFLNRRLMDSREDEIVVPEFVAGLANSFDPTLMDLLQRIGPMTLLGSISAFIFRNESGILENHQHHVDLMTSFPHVGLLLEQFHSRPAIVLGNRHVVCRIENHRLDTFDYARLMQRSPHYGLSVGYAKLLYSLAVRKDFPIYRIQSAREFSPYQARSLTVPEFIAYHLKSGSAAGDPANIYELGIINETFKNFSSPAARKEYQLIELGLRTTWFAHRLLFKTLDSSGVAWALKLMAGGVYGLRRMLAWLGLLRRLLAGAKA